MALLESRQARVAQLDSSLPHRGIDHHDLDLIRVQNPLEICIPIELLRAALPGAAAHSKQ